MEEISVEGSEGAVVQVGLGFCSVKVGTVS
jgi:hypothetical protein